jgi:hypothetical protein
MFNTPAFKELIKIIGSTSLTFLAKTHGVEESIIISQIKGGNINLKNQLNVLIDRGITETINIANEKKAA